jgi:hypothetical protein
MKTPKSKRPLLPAALFASPRENVGSMGELRTLCGHRLHPKRHDRTACIRTRSRLGHDWKYHRGRGDKLIRVMVTPIIRQRWGCGDRISRPA